MGAAYTTRNIALFLLALTLIDVATGGRDLGGLLIALVIASAVWVFFDAPVHGMPRVYAVAVLLLWIVGYPAYLFERSRVRRTSPQPVPRGANPPSPPPPGWYLDPAGNPEERWWDGERWTDHRKRPANE